MRKLSIQQKRAIKKLYDATTGIVIAEDLDQKEINRIWEMNQYETFWQDVNRFLGDMVAQRWQEKYGF